MRRDARNAPDPEIRLAGPGDGGGLAALVRAFRDHLGATTPSDRELAERLPEALADPSLEFACAWLEDRAVGYTQTRFFASLWTPGGEAVLEDLFVLAELRGRGVGRLLLRHALQRARERGATRLGLTTNERNVLINYLGGPGATLDVLNDVELRERKLGGLFTLVLQSPVYQTH